MMILLMTVMMKVRGGGAEELEPDDAGQLPVRVHQLAVDSVLGGGLLVPLLPPPPRPPHHPAHRGQQIDSHITGVSAIHLTLLTITSAEECSAVQLLLFCQPIYNLRAGICAEMATKYPSLTMHDNWPCFTSVFGYPELWYLAEEAPLNSTAGILIFKILLFQTWQYC